LNLLQRLGSLLESLRAGAESLSTSDWVAISIGALAIIVALLIGQYQIRVARQLAIQSGQFKQPGLAIYFGNIDLRKSSLDIVYGTSWADKEYRPLILRVIFRNQGSRAAQHVKMGIVLPILANYGWDGATFAPDRGIVPGFVSRAVKIGELVQSDVYVPVLPPGESGAFDQPFWLPSTTEINRDLTVTTRDGIDVSMGVKGSYSLKFDVTLHSQDDQPIVASIRVQAYPAASIRELAQACLKANLGGPERSNPWIVSVWRRWFSRDKRQFLLIMPEFLPAPDGADTHVGYEDLDRSQRWLLSKVRGWVLTKVNWKFPPSRNSAPLL
jgi:hypothetical protein